jgi:hypothetical protein
MHDRVRCGAAEPTGAPSHLPECVCWPSSAPDRSLSGVGCVCWLSPAPDRGLSDTPGFDNYGADDFSSSLQLSALHSVGHSRVHCSTVDPPRAPSLLPGCPYWPSSAPGRGRTDAPRLDVCGLPHSASSPESAVLDNVVHDWVRWDVVEPTRAPSHPPVWVSYCGLDFVLARGSPRAQRDPHRSSERCSETG